MILILMLSTSSLLFSCAVKTVAREGVPNIETFSYESLIEKKTQNIESYDGIANQLNVSVTKLDTQMSEAILARSAQVYEWDKSVYEEERKKVNSELATKTSFFMSFYTPERVNNNLTSLKPLWKIYLDLEGKRFEGKVVKIKSPLSDLQALYPFHNRFSTAYRVEFSIPTLQSETHPEVLTITGPNATVKLQF